MVSSNESIHSYGVKAAETEASHEDGVTKIETLGEGGEFVVLGGKKYYKHELMSAFGGTLNPGYAPYPKRQMGNPAPMGVAGFSLTTLLLSFYNAQAMGVTTPNAVVGVACFYGGVVQLLAGVLEIIQGNTFGGTALTSYGAFWLSYIAIQVESFGIAAAYGEDETKLANSIGFFLLGWGLFTFMLVLCTLKSTLAFFLLFFFLFLTFILLAAGEFTGKVGVTRAGGVFGIITAFIGFYNVFAGMATKTNSYFTINPLPLTRA